MRFGARPLLSHARQSRESGNGTLPAEVTPDREAPSVSRLRHGPVPKWQKKFSLPDFPAPSLVI